MSGISGEQSQGLGGLSYKSTNDLSGTVADVTNGNPVGTPYKNGKGLVVIQDSANDLQVILAADASLRVLGVLGNAPKAGQAAQVKSVRGTSAKVLSGAAFIKGSKLMPDANGRSILLTAGGHHGHAVAMEAATAAGQLIEAVLTDEYLA
jgi:hypothetical protein